MDGDRLAGAEQPRHPRSGIAPIAERDGEEEAIAAGAGEIGRRKYPVVEAWQPGEQQKSEKPRQHRADHRALEQDRAESGPGRQRPAADIERIEHRRGPILHGGAGQQSGDATAKHDGR